VLNHSPKMTSKSLHRLSAILVIHNLSQT
jgi:hypothetical protein